MMITLYGPQCVKGIEVIKDVTSVAASDPIDLY